MDLYANLDIQQEKVYGIT